MRATEIITESKKTDASKPRNFVAKNAKMGGAGKMQDKSKTIPRKEKHKQKEVVEAEGNKVQQIEAMISQLEQLMPAVMQLQKNHYEFEAIEDEIGSLAEPVSQLSDSSARVDMQDAMENAVESIRKANGAIYEIEKALKYLIKSANYSLDDARDEAEYESRFGGGPALEEGSEDIPFAGKRVGQKAGPAGQLKGKDPKGYPKGKLVGGGM
jgi:DNA repair exonuclease SbcCD ATPase subunit